jgi:hypothetical protein
MRVQVDRVLQPGRERGHRRVGVVAGPVEPAVHRPLHPLPQRAEQRRRRRVEMATATGEWNDSTRVASSTSPAYTPDQQPGHDRIGQSAGDDPVDLIQPVLQDPGTDGHRQPTGNGLCGPL